MPVTLPEGFDEEYDSAGASVDEAPSSWLENEYAVARPPVRPPPSLAGAWQSLNTPLVPLSRLSPSAQTTEDALSVLGSESPELTSQEAQAVLERPTDPSTLAKILAGATGSVLRGAESMTSPLMLATLGTAALPRLVQRAAALGFGGLMASQVPEASRKLGEAVASGDPEAITSAATDAAQLGLFIPGAGLHAFGPNRVPFPESLRELVKTEGERVPSDEPRVAAIEEALNQPAQGEARAIQEPSAETPIRGVQEPRVNEPLPAEERGGEVPQRTIPPGDQEGAPRAEEAGKSEVPLKEEAVETLTPTVRIGEQSFKGRAHPLAIAEASKSLAADAPIEDLFKPESQGFTATDPVTGKERFITRKEGAEIFTKQTGKQPATPDKLTSEDLRDAGLLGHMDEKPAAPASGASAAPAATTPEVFKLAASKYKNPQGDPMGTTYRATPEDWAKWQEQQANLAKFVKAGGDLGSPEGQALFKENERIKNKYGGMPPQPPKVAEAQTPPLAAPAAQAAPVPAAPASRGIAAAVRAPGALNPAESGKLSLAPVANLVRLAAPAVKSAFEAVKAMGEGAKETGQEAFGTRKMTDYRRSVLNWSAKLQKSFGEAAAAQKDIQTRVPNAVRREGITNWIQADGDAALLRQRAAATTDPKLKAGYEAALNLTPDEIAVANQVKATYAALGQRGQVAEVINNFKDNYVTQIWDLGKTKSGAPSGSSRTLKERFKFSKASTFPTFFDGEQAGFTPKTKDISKLLPVYTHEMNSVIAARELVEQMSKGVASDGRPLVAPRGTGVPVQGQQGVATLVMPKAIKGDTGDYRVLANQPALQDWRWASKDSAGNPVFLKSDLALHPEAYDRIKAVLGKSAIREWYQTPTTKLAAIPKGIVRGLDFANSETKRTMLGLLAPFHQVQTGTHAVGHRVNPFGNIPKVDLVNDARQMDAAKHGLMLLPDRASESQFMEGFKTSGLVSKIPGIGPLADMYSNYLFKQYIPGLKFKTYQAILDRNTKVYAKDLAAGKLKPEDVKVLSAEQANAAYGHLNYADIGRNPTIGHIAQLGLLAPDFLEARGRFAGQAIKGLTGAKVGREQLVALATLAIGQATAAFVTAKLSGGEWDKEHPFEFHVGSRKYTIRSVPEDIATLLTNTRSFVHNRLSPLIGKGALQYLSGTDFAGRKVTAGQTTKELLTQPIPLTLRSLPWIRSVSGADRPGNINAWEQLAGAVGLKIGRFNPSQKINQLHRDWLKKQTDPKTKADYERNLTATFPVSKYKALDSALADKDEAGAVKAIADLKAEGQKNKEILARMRPYVGEGINSRTKPLFHESHKLEAQFRNSLTPEQRADYQAAMKERLTTWREFLRVWQKRGSAAPAE